MNVTLRPAWLGLLVLSTLVSISGAPAVAAAPEMAPPSLAVMYFDYTGKNTDLEVLKKGLAQMLISDLEPRADNCVIVERERLEDIMKELELGQSKKVDPATAAKVGKLMGARYMVLGSFFDLFGQFRVDGRVIDVETGAILGSVGKTGKADDFLALEQALADGLAAILKEKAKPVPLTAKKKKRKASKKKPKKRKKRKAKAGAKPVKIKAATVLEYSKALDAKDRGDKEAAAKHLKAVVQKQPDFEAAAMDLDSLVQ
ncbi:MAG: CsgG/HfaB family protein [Myxococcota bacterium]|nr:CsgG/HfaB family protein [Myxococcota bacterium]